MSSQNVDGLAMVKKILEKPAGVEEMRDTQGMNLQNVALVTAHNLKIAAEAVAHTAHNKKNYTVQLVARQRHIFSGRTTRNMFLASKQIRESEKGKKTKTMW